MAFEEKGVLVIFPIIPTVIPMVLLMTMVSNHFVVRLSVKALNTCVLDTCIYPFLQCQLEEHLLHAQIPFDGNKQGYHWFTVI